MGGKGGIYLPRPDREAISGMASVYNKTWPVAELRNSVDGNLMI